jgi:hypothetical protein
MSKYFTGLARVLWCAVINHDSVVLLEIKNNKKDNKCMISGPFVPNYIWTNVTRNLILE